MSGKKINKAEEIETFGEVLQGCRQNDANLTQTHKISQPGRPPKSITEQPFCIPARAQDVEPTPDILLSFMTLYLLAFPC